MWELNYKESWALKNWCFWTVLCWRRLLRVPWTVWRSNQSIRKEISPEYSLEGLMLKLKLMMWRTDSLEKTLMMGKTEGRRRRGQQRMRWMVSPTGWTWVWASSRSWWWTGNLACYSPWGCKELDKSEQLNWNLAHRKYTMFWFRMLRLGEKTTNCTQGKERTLRASQRLEILVTKLDTWQFKKRNGRRIVSFDETSILYKLHHIFGEQHLRTCN